MTIIAYENGAWTLGSSGDTGTPVPLGIRGGVAACVQVTGTVGTTTIQVSNDGTNWFTLKDIKGDPVVFTAVGLTEFSSSAKWLRPSFGAGAANCTVLLSMKG